MKLFLQFAKSIHEMFSMGNVDDVQKSYLGCCNKFVFLYDQYTSSSNTIILGE